jgi:hypothetical protein
MHNSNKADKNVCSQTITYIAYNNLKLFNTFIIINASYKIVRPATPAPTTKSELKTLLKEPSLFRVQA